MCYEGQILKVTQKVSQNDVWATFSRYEIKKVTQHFSLKIAEVTQHFDVRANP